MKKKRKHVAITEVIDRIFQLGLQEGMTPLEITRDIVKPTKREEKIFEILKQKRSRSRIT